MPSLVRVIVVVCLCAVGCASPAPLVRLSPRTVGAITWVAGRAVLESEAAGIRVAVAFEQQDQRLLGIRVEIANGGPSRIEVRPADVTYVTCRGADNATCGGAFAVVDPEEMLAALDERQSLERAQAANEQGLFTGLVLLSAVGDVATIAAGRADRTTGIGTANLAHHASSSAARSEATRSQLASGRDLWSNAAFRRTTIAAGGGAGGLVYLPVREDAQYVWLQVRAGGQTFPFAFKQTVRQVRTASTGGRANR